MKPTILLAHQQDRLFMLILQLKLHWNSNMSTYHMQAMFIDTYIQLIHVHKVVDGVEIPGNYISCQEC